MDIQGGKVDFGQTISEHDFKAALRKCNSSFHFDVGGKLDIKHPWMNKRQGIYWNGRYIGTMERGFIPEYNVYSEVNGAHFGENGELVRTKNKGVCMTVGWRHSLERVIGKAEAWKIPGVNRINLCNALGVSVKVWRGEERVDEVYSPDTGIYHKPQDAMSDLVI